MGKTRDLFKKIRDTKGTFHAKMGLIKDRNGMDLTEAGWPWEAQSSPRVGRESWALRSGHCRPEETSPRHVSVRSSQLSCTASSSQWSLYAMLGIASQDLTYNQEFVLLSLDLLPVSLLPPPSLVATNLVPCFKSVSCFAPLFFLQHQLPDLLVKPPWTSQPSQASD